MFSVRLLVLETVNIRLNSTIFKFVFCDYQLYNQGLGTLIYCTSTVVTKPRTQPLIFAPPGTATTGVEKSLGARLSC